MARCGPMGCNNSLAMQVAKFGNGGELTDILAVPDIASFWYADGLCYQDVAKTTVCTNGTPIKVWVDNTILNQDAVWSATDTMTFVDNGSDPKHLLSDSIGFYDNLDLDPSIDISNGVYTIVLAVQLLSKSVVPYALVFSNNQTGSYNDTTQFAGGVWIGDNTPNGVYGTGIYHEDGQLVRQTDGHEATGGWFVYTFREDSIRVNKVDVGDPGGIEYRAGAVTVNAASTYFRRIGVRSANMAGAMYYGVSVVQRKITDLECETFENFFMEKVGLI